VTERRSAEYLSSECLVHFFRQFSRLNQPVLRDAVVWALLDRCERILLARIDTGLPNAEALRQDVLHEFALLLANDGEGGVS
jgi:hypothetical protein